MSIVQSKVWLCSVSASCQVSFLVKNMDKSMSIEIYEHMSIEKYEQLQSIEFFGTISAALIPSDTSTCLHNVSKNTCIIHTFLFSTVVGCGKASFCFGCFGQKKSKIITMFEVLKTPQGIQKRSRAKSFEILGVC